MPLTAQDWTEIAAWADKRDRSLYNRLLLNRLFRGTVTATNLTLTPYQVQIQRVGEAQPDGAWYACLSGFVPLIGDIAEVIWQDDKVAVVIGILSRSLSYTRFRVYAHASSATSLPNVGALNAFTGIALQVADDDPNGDFSTAASTYTPRQAGWYRVSWGAAVPNATATVLLVSLFKNSVEYRRAMGYSGGAFQTNVGLSTKILMNGTTDFLNIAAVQNSGGTLLTANNPADAAFLTAELVSTP